MIWLGAAILVTLLYIALCAWMLPTHLGIMERHIAETANKLQSELEEIRARLASIEGHTSRLPRPPEKRLPEYPGDPLGKWPTE